MEKKNHNNSPPTKTYFSKRKYLIKDQPELLALFLLSRTDNSIFITMHTSTFCHSPWVLACLAFSTVCILSYVLLSSLMSRGTNCQRYGARKGWNIWLEETVWPEGRVKGLQGQSHTCSLARFPVWKILQQSYLVWGNIRNTSSRLIILTHVLLSTVEVTGSQIPWNTEV